MLALLCGGQGKLSPDVFRLTAGHPSAAPVYRRATELLGKDPRTLVQEGEAAVLGANRTGQILAVTASLALHACLSASLPGELMVAGYSVGEVAAWAVAGIWSPAEALDLAARRAEAMDKVDGGHGGLAYVRGLDRAHVEALAEEHGCALAIINPYSLMVVGGRGAELDAFCAAARAAGAAKSARLGVHVASHTPALAGAVYRVKAALDSVPPRSIKANTILFNAGSASRIFDPIPAVADLASDVARTLNWSATLNAMLERQPHHVLDLGPGHAMAEMVRPLAAGLPVRAADDFRTLGGIMEWLCRE